MTRLALAISLLFLVQLAFPQSADNETRMLINLMDYIAKDYGMAVQNGEVVSEFEFAEMQEFVQSASDYHTKLTQASIIDTHLQLGSHINSLSMAIVSKSSSEKVANIADEIKAKILALNLVAQSPKTWPDMNAGKSAFSVHCASCHGATGDGNGPVGAGLNPSPTNFTDRNIMNGVAPFQAFNTIRLGIPGTGMRGFEELSDEQIWNLAFYIESLHYDSPSSQNTSNAINLEEIATLSDEELIGKYSESDIRANRLGSVETNTNASIPTEVARTLLKESLNAYKSEQFDLAADHALNAYLKGIELIEPQIKASDNALFQELESSMMAIRAGIKARIGYGEMTERVEHAMMVIDEADAVLMDSKRGMLMTAFIAITILVREGLEAFFVILAILGVLRTVDSPSAIRWLHGGWISAVVMGIAGWFFADSLLNFSAESRELMEGLIALIAVVVLLYLGFWLHGKTEAAKWKEFVETKIKSLINSNNMIGLGAFSFVVVFREAFESVLFLSSLTTDGQSESKIGVLIGFIGAAAILLFVAWAILKWFKKLPIRKVFLYSSIVILALAFVLAGDGIHAIQEGGYLDIRSFPMNIKLPLLGIYPTYETMVVQIAVLVAITILWKVNSKKSVS
ncbi:MAG: FTR1 family protein [Flavobacteriales bacterium]